MWECQFPKFTTSPLFNSANARRAIFILDSSIFLDEGKLAEAAKIFRRDVMPAPNSQHSNREYEPDLDRWSQQEQFLLLRQQQYQRSCH
jgi:hypothetical protein